MKTLAKYLIAVAIVTIPIFLSNVIAHYTEKDFASVYCQIASFVIGMLSSMAAGQIIDKITDKNERV